MSSILPPLISTRHSTDVAEQYANEEAYLHSLNSDHILSLNDITLLH